MVMFTKLRQREFFYCVNPQTKIYIKMNFMKATENSFLGLGILILEEFVDHRVSRDSAEVCSAKPLPRDGYTVVCCSA
jgi:hypothetical protein